MAKRPLFLLLLCIYPKTLVVFQLISVNALFAKLLIHYGATSIFRSMDTDYRKILRRELEQRINRNPRYSLRSFAKDLKVAPALMSDVLNEKRGLSRFSATRIANRIGLSSSETETFCDLVKSKHARSRLSKLEAQE